MSELDHSAVAHQFSCGAVSPIADFPLSSITQKTTAYHSLNYLMTPMVMVSALVWLAAGIFLVLTGQRVINPGHGHL